MEVRTTKLPGCLIVKPPVFTDSRGYFFESFNQELFEKKSGLQINFVQDNQSFSTKGTLRGLHFQRGIHQQAKLVRVIQGEILDVVVDIRENSPTFGQHFSMILNDKEQEQLFIPRGFAHGFLVLSETAIFAYKCDNYYNKQAESGILYNDPILNISWSNVNQEYLISDKDLLLPSFLEILPL
ncbi:dTDP-4-dehydrorhamnose 3,5-epimerase [Myroides sp. NP-2]|uniref:dTDP-4-dehydrorhamnose 3,5-epimerase n=1 Tax=Myroides sp. NP-2 TaxID=2759945 RepID=UPI0015FD4492|nr:dTDP-4-dehydrorhamnose 3,5-epimerase [Myroides sp. NP-2]MBB1150985.1 dTDP-4-dehydrorhamnose 3,5-epimerase [Myroides sp. NP-2]